MDLLACMNEALAYLEAHLDQPVDGAAISRITACPFSVFQRMFVPLTGVTLSEYLRRRRLSLAAEDLQHTRLRVVDIALRYGYENADAFSAAFKRMHGLSPQQARTTQASLTFYPKMIFKFTLMGVQEMQYRYQLRPPFRVMGIRMTTPTGGGTWGKIKKNGMFAQIGKLCGHPCNLGLCFGFDEQGNNDYLCGVQWEGNAPVGFVPHDYPALGWLTFTAKGSISSGVLGQTWQRIYGEFMPGSSYRQLDYPTIEQYHHWDLQADECHVDIHIPVTAVAKELV